MQLLMYPTTIFFFVKTKAMAGISALMNADQITKTRVWIKFPSLIDLNECYTSDANNCSVNADCVNKPGTFECNCKPGYTGDGVVCNGKGFTKSEVTVLGSSKETTKEVKKEKKSIYQNDSRRGCNLPVAPVTVSEIQIVSILTLLFTLTGARVNCSSKSVSPDIPFQVIEPWAIVWIAILLM